jgi:hypothetical protein
MKYEDRNISEYISASKHLRQRYELSLVIFSIFLYIISILPEWKTTVRNEIQLIPKRNIKTILYGSNPSSRIVR